MAFYKERVALEEEYARRMHAISKRALGSYESSHLRVAFETLRSETEQIARSHSNEARKLNSESMRRLNAFTSDFVAKRKPLEHAVGNIRKRKQALELNVMKLKESYHAGVIKLNSLSAQSNILLGKEQDRNRERIYQQQQIVGETRQEYQLGVKKLREIQATWVQEWRISSDKLQDLESQRIEFLVANLWEYSNTVSACCVNDDASCETVRKALEECNPSQEIEDFAHKFGTGTELYSVPDFVDYINGETDGTAHSMVPQTIPHPQSRMETRSSSERTLVRHEVPISFDPALQGSSQQPINVEELRIFDEHNNRRPVRRAPPSEDGQTSISNPSSNPSYLHREDTGYSNPTSVSSFTSMASERVGKTWNSPARRRSRNSEAEWSRKSSNRRSFVLGEKPKEYVIPDDEDPLRATLEDLKQGGNGDMHKLSEFRSSNSTRKERPKSMVETQASSSRPKSMAEVGSMGSSMNKTSSFHAGLRSQSKSSSNIQAKLGAEGVPPTTREGRRVIRHCKALFDFTATIEGELSFREGDDLLVVHMQEDGWWECERQVDGNVGLAPYNYLERVS